MNNFRIILLFVMNSMTISFVLQRTQHVSNVKDAIIFVILLLVSLLFIATFIKENFYDKSK